MVVAQRMLTDGRGDKITGYQNSALVDQLVERMLPIGAGFAPVDVVKSNSTCSRYVPAYANVIWLLLTIEIPLALFVVLKVTAFGVDATGLVWFPELVKFP